MEITKEELMAIEELVVGRLEVITKRFDALEECVDSIDKHIEHLESDVTSLKEGQRYMNKRMIEVSAKVNCSYKLALESLRQIEEVKVRLSFLEG